MPRLRPTEMLRQIYGPRKGSKPFLRRNCRRTNRADDSDIRRMIPKSYIRAYEQRTFGTQCQCNDLSLTGFDDVAIGLEPQLFIGKEFSGLFGYGVTECPCGRCDK